MFVHDATPHTCLRCVPVLSPGSSPPVLCTCPSHLTHTCPTHYLSRTGTRVILIYLLTACPTCLPVISRLQRRIAPRTTCSVIALSKVCPATCQLITQVLTEAHLFFLPDLHPLLSCPSALLCPLPHAFPSSPSAHKAPIPLPSRHFKAAIWSSLTGV